MKVILISLITSLASVTALAYEASEKAPEPTAAKQYTYAWKFTDSESMAPRGGTTTGPEVVLDDSPSQLWLDLQTPDLSKKEQDRRAILALVGDYRTSFDFIETIGFAPDYTPAAPYQSWATERVYLVKDEPDFISLQHILVMHFIGEDGNVSEPMVVKHWRQDWRYEDATMLSFLGNRTWATVAVPKELRKGSWTQSVYQVDDSPQYEAIGRWHHTPNYSTWDGEEKRRPLPRREFSVRDDYHTLVGSHRITITPTGWVQEEDALKVVLDENNQLHPETPYLAREAGLSRYQRIQDYDFSAGDDYWAETAAFWAQVRAYWDDVVANQDQYTLKAQVDDMPMFAAMFQLADEQSEPDLVEVDAVSDRLNAYFN
ncbi:MAG: DUF6607 family protein [Pseudomonadota bacterium]